MIRKITLLNSSFAAILFSATPMAADFHSHTGFQKTSPTPFLEAALTTTDGGAECMTIDDSIATGWNTGEICLASDIDASTTSFSAAADLRVANLMAQQDVGLFSIPGAECISAGGSGEATGSTVGFCMAADLSTSETDIQHFSFKNGLPATGMQFLQAIFADGSTQSVSGAQIGQECLSPDGSPSTIGNEDSGGFCMISSLKKSLEDFAIFSIANALPVVGLQFLQVKFADSSSLGGIPPSSDTECLSIGGSTAKSTGGFCLASDLSTSTVKSVNFSVAHNAPVTDLQFMQVTFGGDSPTDGLLSPPGLGAPIGAECISVEGSIGATGNPEGFCLVSDLIESSMGSSRMAVANDFPVSGLQFLQVKFTDGSSPGGLPTSPGLGAPIGTECVSSDGSIAATGNADGFCLVSDLINRTIGSASFSVANDLPVMSWEFLQVPSEGIPRLGGLNYGAPVGIVVSDFMVLPFDIQSSFDIRSPSTLLDIIARQTPFFHVSDQTSGMEAYSTSFWRDYPHLGLWVGR